MTENRPHARHAAAARRRKAERRARLVRIGIPTAAIALAVGVGLLVSGGGSDSTIAPGSSEQLAAGEEIFADNCATCHGTELTGGLAGPPLVHELYRPDHHPDSSIRSAIANGVEPHHWDFSGMPPIRGLSRDDVDAVIAYVRDVQETFWASQGE